MRGKSRGLVTPLPPSPLRSGGPGLQESLHHYALRMAAQCCLTIRKLEEFLLRDDPRAPKAGNAIFPSSWIGPRSNFRSLLAALEHDTGVHNLHTGTFHVLADVMGRGGTRRRQIRGEGRVWCPACYLDWDDPSSSEPLIWAFDMLTACPNHGVQLESRCSSCGVSQEFSAGYRHRRKCQRCQCSLAHGKGARESDKQALWVNAALLEFTTWIATVDTPITNEKYLEFLAEMRARPNGEPLPPPIRGYIAMEYHRRALKRSLPTVTTLLNLAAFQGVAIHEILCHPSFAASPRIVPGVARFDGLLFRRRDLTRPHRRVVYVIDKLASGASPLPPPSVLWRELGLWCDGVRDYCPLEHESFTTRFRTQDRLLSVQRFKLGATSCMRLLEKGGVPVDFKESLIQHLVQRFDFNAAAAEQCASACAGLREALALSEDEGELLAFETRLAHEVAQWAANGS